MDKSGLKSESVLIMRPNQIGLIKTMSDKWISLNNETKSDWTDENKVWQVNQS